MGTLIKEMAAQAELSALQRELIALYSEVVHGKGLPSTFMEDYDWPKTTPVTAMRLISKELERMDRTTKEWAFRLRMISKSLNDIRTLLEP